MSLQRIRRSISRSFSAGQHVAARFSEGWRILRSWALPIVWAVTDLASMLFGRFPEKRFRTSQRTCSKARVRRASSEYPYPTGIPALDMSSRFGSGRLRYRMEDTVVEEIDGQFQFVEVTALPSVTRRNRLLLLFSVRDSEKVLADWFCRRHYLYYN